jgi:hypothetical protein
MEAELSELVIKRVIFGWGFSKARRYSQKGPVFI